VRDFLSWHQLRALPEKGFQERRGARAKLRNTPTYGRDMIDKSLFADLSERIAEAARNSPVQDLEKNLRALLAAFFDRLDLVLREDFEVQKRLLERAQAKLAELEKRVKELESR
jgi:BMFP domain-containing protein YqiC